MNTKPHAISLTVSLLMICLSTSLAFAQDGLLKEWRQSGSRPQDFEIVVDETVKHAGKASARIDFMGERFVGFLSFTQIFNAGIDATRLSLI